MRERHQALPRTITGYGEMIVGLKLTHDWLSHFARRVQFSSVKMMIVKDEITEGTSSSNNSKAVIIVKCQGLGVLACAFESKLTVNRLVRYLSQIVDLH